jgi:uncharacterized protein YggE
MVALAAVVSTSVALAQDVADTIVPGADRPARRPRSITVVGVGRERGTPDVAELRIAVEQNAPTAQAASQAAAKAAGQVVETLKKEVGADGRVDTASFQLTPVYRTDPPTPQTRSRGPEIVSYTAINELAVRTRRLDRIGALLDAAIAAGAGRVSSLAFTVDDPAPLQARALRAAGTDAAAQAAAIAEALHVTLKGVLEATTETVEPPMPKHFRGAMMHADAAMAPTPIEPGEVTADARVRVTYAIE